VPIARQPALPHLARYVRPPLPTQTLHPRQGDTM